MTTHGQHTIATFISYKNQIKHNTKRGDASHHSYCDTLLNSFLCIPCPYCIYTDLNKNKEQDHLGIQYFLFSSDSQFLSLLFPESHERKSNRPNIRADVTLDMETLYRHKIQVNYKIQGKEYNQLNNTSHHSDCSPFFCSL